MTHHTDAELLHALEESQSLFAAMLHEPRPTSEIQKQMEQNRAAIDAARRAAAAPVPQGWRLVPEWPTVEMSVAGDDVYREDGPDVFSSNTIYTRMLAAAPQPPEAAPVQLPEPDGYIMDSLPNGRLEYKRGPLSQMDSVCNSTMPVYEYGTVRQLLAANGIGKDKA